jgi:hypothetical protein
VSTVDRAQKLAAKGLPVFPCKNRPGTEDDKAPLTARGFHDASTNPNHIANWWWRWPDALIAVPTGIRFDVLDADLQHVEAREWLAKQDLPPTRIHHTRSGGRHFLFRPNARNRCTASAIAPHIDTRGAGGYIIWWPAHGFPIENADLLAEAPAFAVPPAAPRATVPFRRRRGPIRAAFVGREIERLVGMASAALNGTRDNTTFFVACRLCEMGGEGLIDLGEAEQLVIAAAATNGLGAAVGAKKFQSALRTVARQAP